MSAAETQLLVAVWFVVFLARPLLNANVYQKIAVVHFERRETLNNRSATQEYVDE